MRPVFAALTLCVFTGCDNFGALVDQKPRTLTIGVTDLAHPSDGSDPVPKPIPSTDPNAPACTAWVDQADNGGWVSVEGAYVADGQCVIHTVPQGATLIKLKHGWLTITENVLDLGGDTYGRPYSTAKDGTTVTVDFSNALPFDFLTDISMFIIPFAQGLNNGGGSRELPESVPDGTVGATSFPVTFDWSSLPLLQGNEKIDVYQYKSALASKTGVQLQLAKHGTADVRPVDGNNVRGSAVMTNLPSTPHAIPAVTFDPTLMALDLYLAIPNPVLTGALVGQNAALQNSFESLQVQSAFDTGDASSDTVNNISLGASSIDPFPGLSWSGRITAGVFYGSTVGSDESSTSATANLTSAIQGPADDLGWMSSTELTPVKNITVRNPDNSTQDRGLLPSLTPTLQWSKPEMGLANFYHVTPTVRVTVGDHQEFQPLGTQVLTTATEAHIPPDMLKPDTDYIFYVEAENCEAADPKRPLAGSVQPTCAIVDNRSFMFTTPSQ